MDRWEFSDAIADCSTLIWDDSLVLMDVDLVDSWLESDDMLFSVAVACFTCWHEEIMVHVELLVVLFSSSSICDWIIFHSSCSFVDDSIDDIVVVYVNKIVLIHQRGIAAR